jgi:RNA polymerase sigma-70 factor (ECF subfamily)
LTVITITRVCTTTAITATVIITRISRKRRSGTTGAAMTTITIIGATMTGNAMTAVTMTADTMTADTMGMTGPAVTKTCTGCASGILDAGRGHAPMQGRIGHLAVTWPELTRMQGQHTIGAHTTPGMALDRSTDNNQALESFFVEHEDKAFYIAYAALWDREAAMDVVQDSMLRLVQYYRHKPENDWPALFRTILNSRINDVRRKRLLEQGKHKLVSLTGLFRGNRDDEYDNSEFELPAAERDDGVSAPEVEYIAQELRQQVTQALQALSERQRQVFILREWRGMSISETATTLGCSENSIKQHHFRAMRELRKQLAEVWDYAQPTAS